jgi:hypothetical protein
MSKFSGKCDFYDHISIAGLENVLKSQVYLDRSPKPLNLVCEADCVPYYPYLVISSSCTHGVGVIYLTERSWVDTEEKQIGPLPAHDMYRAFLRDELDRVAGGHSSFPGVTFHSTNPEALIRYAERMQTVLDEGSDMRPLYQELKRIRTKDRGLRLVLNLLLRRAQEYLWKE